MIFDVKVGDVLEQGTVVQIDLSGDEPQAVVRTDDGDFVVLDVDDCKVSLERPV